MASTNKEHEWKYGTANSLSKPSTSHHVSGRPLLNDSSATDTQILLSAAGQSYTTANSNTLKVGVKVEEAKDIKPLLDNAAHIHKVVELGNSGKRKADTFDGIEAPAPKVKKKRMSALNFWPDSFKENVQSASSTIASGPRGFPPILKEVDLQQTSPTTTSRPSIALSFSNEACLATKSTRVASQPKIPSPGPSKETYIQQPTSNASLEPAAPPPGADAPSTKAKTTKGEKKRASRAKNDSLYIDAPGMPVNGIPGRAHLINLETYNSLKGDFDLRIADIIGTILYMYDCRVRDAFLRPSIHPEFRFRRVARKENPHDVTYDFWIGRSDRLVTESIFVSLTLSRGALLTLRLSSAVTAAERANGKRNFSM